MIYLDNAATSWPKPTEVSAAMLNFLEQVGGNPGRSGHRSSVEAARILYNTRESVAHFFNAPDPLRVIFTLNATHAINYALKGLLKPGDKVLTTSVEHNAVMRPLRALEQEGVILNIVKCNKDSSLNLHSLEQMIDTKTKLIIINHASNVTGTILPVKEISAITSKFDCLLLLDAAQTAGVLSIDMLEMGIDLLAFTGHKGLLGPTGTGGLIIGNKVDVGEMKPLIHGGTGSRSQFEYQPVMLPDKYESGTPNIVGVAGLFAGIQWINQHGIEFIRNHEINLINALLTGLSEIKGIRIYGKLNASESIAILSITLDNHSVSELSLRFDEEHDILCRSGLHCAPAAHKTIGTFPGGTVRLAPGIFTSPNDIHKTTRALELIANE